MLMKLSSLSMDSLPSMEETKFESSIHVKEKEVGEIVAEDLIEDSLDQEVLVMEEVLQTDLRVVLDLEEEGMMEVLPVADLTENVEVMTEDPDLMTGLHTLHENQEVVFEVMLEDLPLMEVPSDLDHLLEGKLLSSKP